MNFGATLRAQCTRTRKRRRRGYICSNSGLGTIAGEGRHKAREAGIVSRKVYGKEDENEGRK